MSTSPLISKWVGEFCAPVVVTVATAEVESICLKNGLLFHELLSAFGKLDNVNSSIRSSSQQLLISDAHIRFERSTEVRVKSSGSVEELLRASFEECDLSRVPGSVSEISANPPTSWTQRAEQLVARSMSFSEYEMLSHPLILLTAVATTDVDPVACMQELASVHHTPSCLSSGQYDPEIHRVFLLVHDVHAAHGVDATGIFRKLQSRFPPIHTKYLALNSLPPESPHLQQPDIWSRCTIPMYFPQLAPILDPTAPLPTNPLNGELVLGSRLSMEDFVSLRDFCIALFHQELLPSLERRIVILTKIVADARKGVKNVLKTFFRKPRDESPTRSTGGGPRYRSDRIETQTLLLADTCFLIKDYENAAQMYRLVREDYRSDKSMLHLGHTLLMGALCQMLTDPSKLRDMHQLLEGLCQSITAFTEPPHVCAYFALLASEVYLVAGMSQLGPGHPLAIRAALDAALLLLQSASAVSKVSLLSAMMTERAAACFLVAGQYKKFAFHEVLSGYKFLGCGSRPSKHAAACNAAAMIVYEKSHWGGAKVKLLRALADEMKQRDGDGPQRALVLLLKALGALLADPSNVGTDTSVHDAAGVLSDLVAPGPWGLVTVREEWIRMSIQQVLQGALPFYSALNYGPGSPPMGSPVIEGHAKTPRTPCTPRIPSPEPALDPKSTEVFGLPVPELNLPSLTLLKPLNGTNGVLVPVHPFLLPYETDDSASSALANAAEDMRILLEVEQQWGIEQEQEQENLRESGKSKGLNTPSTSLVTAAAAGASAGLVTTAALGSDDAAVKLLAERLVQAERDLHNPASTLYASHTPSPLSQTPAGAPATSGTTNNKSKRSDAAGTSTLRVPVGEPLLLRGRLTNKLPLDLTLTNLRLQMKPLDAFSVDPAEVILSSNEAVDIVLSAIPNKLGRYHAEYMRWNLSEYLSIKHPLRRPGPLLHKTLKQRAHRERGEDKSLHFEVVRPHALLHISLQGISEEVLQGQILRIHINLRNEGAAPAAEIYLKLSHPCFAVCLDSSLTAASSGGAGQILPPWGQSSTIVRLPSGVVIAPGEEFKLTAWLQLNAPGKQTVSLLASYKAIRKANVHVGSLDDAIDGNAIEGDVVEPFGPGQRCRTSFVTFQTTVLNSMVVAARSVSRPTACSQQVLVVEMSNSINPSISSTTTPLISTPGRAGKPLSNTDKSVGQLDEDNLNEDPLCSQLPEGSCKIEGLWVLGCAVPVGDVGASTTDALNANQKPLLMSSPFEKSVVCVPVEVQVDAPASLPPKSTTSSRMISLDPSEKIPGTSKGRRASAPLAAALLQSGRVSWALSPRQAVKSMNPSTESPQLEQIAERLLCSQANSSRFQREIDAARLAVHSEAATVVDKGPRTITQVRKDRQKEMRSEAESEADGLVEGSAAEDGSMFVDVDVDGTDAASISESQSNADSSGSGALLANATAAVAAAAAAALAQTSTSCKGVPLLASQLAAAEAASCSATVAVVWVCRWRGKIRRGMHFCSGISLLSSFNDSSTNNLLVPTVPRPLTEINPADSLFAAVVHAPTTALEPITGVAGGRPVALLPVTLELRSAYAKPLVITIEINDKRASRPVTGYGNDTPRDPGALVQPLPKGMRFEDKTKFVGIEVAPFAQVDVPFLVSFTRAGVFNVNRFRIIVQVADQIHNENLASMKIVPGHSLVDVLEK